MLLHILITLFLKATYVHNISKLLVSRLMSYVFAQLSKRNEKGETLLHLAAISGNLTAARQLILQVLTGLFVLHFTLSFPCRELMSMSGTTVAGVPSTRPPTTAR